MKQIPLIALIILATQFAGCSQESKTNAPTSTSEQNQATVPDMSKYVSSDGITIPRDNKGAPSGVGVYFTTIGGDEMSVSLRGTSTNLPLAMLKYTGTMECTRDGRLGGGTDKFKPTQLQTSTNLDKWFKVSSFSIGKDGLLIVTDESGSSFRVKLPVIASQEMGQIEELKKASQ